jgi:hypothetical protein
MTIDAIAAAPIAGAASSTAAAAPAQLVQVGYGVSLSDFGAFQQGLAQASARIEARPVNATSEAAKALVAPFEHINTEAAKLTADAANAQAAGDSLSPGDMVMLTARCQEFSFHCTLMSNIANRTSDGLQQMFRQQS